MGGAGDTGSSKIYLGIVGVGGVGTHFLNQLATVLPTNPRICVDFITSSTKCIQRDPNHPTLPLTTTWAADLAASGSPQKRPAEIISRLAGCPGPAILIDNTSSPAIAAIYADCLAHGISVVTPNKLAFSSSQAQWDALHHHHPTTTNSNNNNNNNNNNNKKRGHLYHESTVGAGLPILSTIQDLLDTGDRIHRIAGVFSGTMSYLFNTFSPSPSATPASAPSPPSWSSIVRTARSLGYTEPDPRDDLNGRDVARKLVILARLVGLTVAGGTDAFPVQSLIPEALARRGGGSADEFLDGLEGYDDEMEALRREAEGEGTVLRFVGSIDVEKGVEGGGVKVGVEKVGRGESVAGLRGSDNLVAVWTERYGEMPVVVQGAGAGGAVTAMGVLADLLRVVRQIPA